MPEQRDAPPAGFTRPFRFDGVMYFWDSRKRMAGDITDDGTPRARGWGRIQYLKNGDEKMTLWEAWFAERIGDLRDPEAIVLALNTVR